MKTFETLLEEGIIVEDNIDETRLANLKYMEKWADSSLTLTLLPTLQCNFRCIYCYEDFKNVHMNEEDVKSITKFVKSKISNYRSVNIDWFGGEPLIKIDVINQISKSLIELCRATKKPYSASMTTNGYLLTADVYKQMIQNKIYNFQITLDGLADTHDKSRLHIRKNNTFETILQNLRMIRDSGNRIATIVIRTNVTKEIFGKFDSYLTFLFKEFGNDSRFKFLFRLAGDWGGEKVSKMEGSLLSDVRVLYERMMNSEFKLDYSVYYELLRSGVCETAFGKNNLLIQPQGKIQKCTCILDNDCNNIGCLKNGKLSIERKKQMAWEFQFDKIPTKCQDCTRYASCFNMGCPVKNINSEVRAWCGWETGHTDEILKLLMNDIDKYPFIRRIK